MRDILFYGTTLGFASGIFIRSFFSFGAAEMLLLLLIAFAFVGVSQIKRSDALFLYSLVAVAFALGAFRFEYSEWRLASSPLREFAGREIMLEGVVSREPDRRESQTLLTVSAQAIDDESTSGLVLASTDRLSDIEYGDRVRISGILREPENFEGDGGHVFDYRMYLRARDVTHTMSYAEIETIGSGEGNPAFAFLYGVKEKFVHALRAVLPEPSSGLAEGLLLGAKRAIGSDLEDIFRTAGIIHIIVLSGYNITLVADFVMRMFGYVFSLRARLIAAIIAIALFAMFVGLSATVVRASVMASLALVARAIGRTYAIMRALVIAGLLMLVLNPHLLVFDPGFQLSFLATIGLIFFAPAVSKRLSCIPAKWNLREHASATIATQAIVLPLLLYSIGELSIVALPVNMLVLPLIPYAMLLSFISGMIGILHPLLALPVGYVAHALLFAVIFIAKLFAALPLSSITLPAFPFWVTLLLYALLALVSIRARRKPRASLPQKTPESTRSIPVLVRIDDTLPFK